MQQTKVKDAIEAAGDVRALAEQIGYSRARVYQWISEGREYLPELAEFRLKEWYEDKQ